MKVLVAALVLLILVCTTTSASHSQAKSPVSVNLPHACCSKYHEKVLPRKLVTGYRKAFYCHLPAIIFVTKKGREVCTDPSNEWVQNYIEDPNLPLLPPKKLLQVKPTPS